MPTLPWSRGPQDTAGDEVLVMGSRLVLRRARDIPGIMRAAVAIRRQVRNSAGAVGVSLIAQPTRKTFWTLSAWRDEAALDSFVRNQPHATAIARYGPRLATAQFLSWKVDAAELPKTRSNARALWDDARRRLAHAQENAKGETNGRPDPA